VIEAIIFDLDGVLVDSEQLWDRARRQVARDHGGTWLPEATAAMQGMSSVEWASYMRDSLGVRLDRRQLIDGVLEQLLAEYAHGLPLLPGALDAVVRLAQRWPLGLASSSNRIVIDRVLELGALTAVFAATVSSEEVPRGKPSPDVYLEAARRLGRAPSKCAAVEDSANGIRAAVAAQAAVVAVPNREFRPPEDVLGTADLVIDTLSELTVERLERLSPRGPLPR
jgi:HAD superfamily hydrolase (TIGR01509 family)